jgi:tetratricopeptide (TPR) repeat protein
MTTFKNFSALLLFLSMVFLIYSPAINGDFVWDDDLHLTDNKQLESVEGLKNIWLKLGATVQYYPLTFTSFWFEKRLWGNNPTGYHIINLLLHASSAIILWRILIMLAIPGAFLAALIFLVHPVNVESVAWITERKNTLSGLFYFVSLIFYLRFLKLEDPLAFTKKIFLQKRNWLLYIFSIISFLLAILSKTATCTLPAVILLLIWWKKGSIKLKDVTLTLPLLFLTFVITHITLSMEKTTVGAKGIHWDLSFLERFIIAGKSLWFYLYSLIFPLNIAFSYPKWSMDSAVAINYLPSLTFLGLIFVLAWFCDKLGKAPLVAILFFSGTLLPTLGFFNFYYMRYSFVSDHFQYLACIGPIAVCSALLTKFGTSLSKFSDSVKISCYFPPTCAVLILLLLCIVTWKQAHIFKSNETLWRNTMKKDPSSGRARVELGREMRKQGEHEEALEHFRKAVVLQPNFHEAHYNLAREYHYKGELSLAISEFKKSLELKSTFHFAIDGLARALAEQGNLKKALQLSRQCIRLQPSFVPGIVTLANILEKLGNSKEAQAYYKRVLKLDLNSYKNYLNLGNSLYRTGNIEKAILNFKKAIHLNSSSTEALYNLGNALGQQKKYLEAKGYYEQVINLDEKLPLPYYGLGLVHHYTGQNLKAVAAFKKALSLKPNLVRAHYFLGKIYGEMRQDQKARFHNRLVDKLSGENKNKGLRTAN